MRIFTDGSKTELGLSVRIACISTELDMIQTSAMNPKASIYTAESKALVDAMLIAFEKRHSNVDIFTDSLSAVMALDEYSIDDHTNSYFLEIHQRNAQFYSVNNHGTKVTVHWIPAHVGITGNKFADKTAKEVTNRAPDLRTIPLTDLKPFYKRSVHHDNVNLLKDEGNYKGRDHFKIIYKGTAKPWFEGYYLSGDKIVFICRCRSNHFGLRESLMKINVVESTACNCRYDPQDLNHILWQCPIYEAERQVLLNVLIKMKIYPPYNVNSFLYGPNVTVMNAIYSFVKKVILKFK